MKEPKILCVNCKYVSEWGESWLTKEKRADCLIIFPGQLKKTSRVSVGLDEGCDLGEPKTPATPKVLAKVNQ